MEEGAHPDFAPFDWSDNCSRNEEALSYYHSSINIEDMMQASMGTICGGMKSMSMMDLSFRQLVSCEYSIILV